MSHPTLTRTLTPLLLLCALCLGLLSDARAHPANVAGGRAKIATDGSFSIQARFDILAYLVGQTPIKVADAPMNALLDGPAADLQKSLKEAETRFAREFTIKADNGVGTVDSVQFPTLAQVQDWRDNGLPPRLPVMLIAQIKGRVPPGAKTISFSLPATLGTFVLTEEVENQEPYTEPLENGKFSAPLPLLTALPTPTPQAPSESPAALYKPKKAANKSATKPKPKAAPAKPAPKVAKKSAPPTAKVPNAKAPKPAAKAPAKSAATQSETSKARDDKKRVALAPVGKVTPPANKPPVAPSDDRTSQAAQQSDATKRASPQAAAAESGSVGAASDKIEGSPKNSVATTAATGADETQIARPNWLVQFGGYIRMGFHHIVPLGWDHILFVLGLFLLGSQLPALLKQITAFTVAHSLTLALAALGLVKVPASITEPLIALSIVFVAVENLATKEVRPWRIGVIFAFGLVHGLGFAEVFENMGLSGSSFVTALVGFNVGVELGQLSIVGAALLAVGWFRKRENYRKFVVVPASLGIAAIAAFWTVQRVFLGG